MSIGKVIAHLLHPHDGSKIGEFELDLVQHGVAIALQDKGLVGKVATQIKAVANPAEPMTGAQKRDAVVKAVLSDVVEFVADPSKAAVDCVDFAHEVVQAVFDNSESSTAGIIASIIVARAAQVAPH